MSVKMEYKQQVDTFCNTYNRVTAEQLLYRAGKEMTATGTTREEKGTLIDFTEKKQQRTAWKKVLSAACIVFLCRRVDYIRLHKTITTESVFLTRRKSVI